METSCLSSLRMSHLVSVGAALAPAPLNMSPGFLQPSPAPCPKAAPDWRPVQGQGSPGPLSADGGLGGVDLTSKWVRGALKLAKSPTHPRSPSSPWEGNKSPTLSSSLICFAKPRGRYRPQARRAGDWQQGPRQTAGGPDTLQGTLSFPLPRVPQALPNPRHSAPQISP